MSVYVDVGVGHVSVGLTKFPRYLETGAASLKGEGIVHDSPLKLKPVMKIDFYSVRNPIN